jgi:uncharacterized protein involved in exopolysaccharide biosynthesis
MERSMEGQIVLDRTAEEQGLTEYASSLLPHWWKILGVSLGAGVVTLLLLLLSPNIYRASATVSPVKDELKKNAALGALASIGLSVGGATEIEELEALFKSQDLTVRVFGKHDLWRTAFAGSLDANGMKKVGLKDKVIGTILGRNTEPKPPGDWDAIRKAKDSLAISSNKKMGLLSISFEAPSQEASAGIVRYYLEEAKDRLQEEAFDRATKNKKFIESQIGKTVDTLNRERLYQLYGQETEREMMARNREQFGFRIIDAPRVPDRKSKPMRGLSAMLAAGVSFAGACAFYLRRKRR